MGPFLAAALNGRVQPALEAHGLTLLDYHRARAAHPDFALACAPIDTAERLAIVASLRTAAASGNLRAIGMMQKGLGDLAVDTGQAAQLGSPLDPDPAIAAAMRAARILALARVRGWSLDHACGIYGRDWIADLPHLDPGEHRRLLGRLASVRFWDAAHALMDAGAIGGYDRAALGTPGFAGPDVEAVATAVGRAMGADDLAEIAADRADDQAAFDSRDRAPNLRYA